MCNGQRTVLNLRTARRFEHISQTNPTQFLALYNTLGVQCAGGPPIAGYVFDTTGSYHTALLAMAVISVITAVLGLVLLKYKSKEVHNRNCRNNVKPSTERLNNDWVP